MKLTADTITDDQIRELFHADEIAAIELTVATLPGWSAEDRRETRAHCAELFNARAITKHAGRTPRDCCGAFLPCPSCSRCMRCGGCMGCTPC